MRRRFDFFWPSIFIGCLIAGYWSVVFFLLIRQKDMSVHHHLALLGGIGWFMAIQSWRMTWSAVWEASERSAVKKVLSALGIIARVLLIAVSWIVTRRAADIGSTERIWTMPVLTPYWYAMGATVFAILFVWSFITIRGGRMVVIGKHAHFPGERLLFAPYLGRSYSVYHERMMLEDSITLTCVDGTRRVWCAVPVKLDFWRASRATQVFDDSAFRTEIMRRIREVIVRAASSKTISAVFVDAFPSADGFFAGFPASWDGTLEIIDDLPAA